MFKSMYAKNLKNEEDFSDMKKRKKVEWSKKKKKKKKKKYLSLWILFSALVMTVNILDLDQ